jgi:hypothetical protein
VSECDFLVGRSIDELRIRNGIRVVFELGDQVTPALYADIGTCTYVDAQGRRHEVAGEDVSTFGPLLEIVGKEVSRVATADGTLILEFTDSSSVQCPPHDRYEAWEVVGGSPQHLVVCMPGGELAVFDQPARPLAGLEAADLPPWARDVLGVKDP